MDGERFDVLVRRSLGDSSRRGVVRAGIGAVATSALATLGLSAVHDAEAGKKKKRKKKKKKKPPPPPAQQSLSPPPPAPDLAGTCTAGQEDLCLDLDFTAANCNGTAGCSCYTKTSNARFCGTDVSAFCPVGGCQNDADCGGAAACAKVFTVDKCGDCADIPTFCVEPCTSS